MVQELSARALRQPVERQRRPHEVPGQLLQLIPPPRRHRHVGVQAEAFQASRAPSGYGHGRR
jgi:hypothetical protein